MATNLLGRPVRLHEAPPGGQDAEGRIALVAIDEQGIHFLVAVDGRLVYVDRPEKLEVLD
jgi:hypothetical protein